MLIRLWPFLSTILVLTEVRLIKLWPFLSTLLVLTEDMLIKLWPFLLPSSLSMEAAKIAETTNRKTNFMVLLRRSYYR